MSICRTQCLTCSDKFDLVYCNYSRFHKICLNCLNQVDSFISRTCFICNSDVKIVSSIGYLIEETKSNSEIQRVDHFRTDPISQSQYKEEAPNTTTVADYLEKEIPAEMGIHLNDMKVQEPPAEYKIHPTPFRNSLPLNLNYNSAIKNNRNSVYNPGMNDVQNINNRHSFEPNSIIQIPKLPNNKPQEELKLNLSLPADTYNGDHSIEASPGISEPKNCIDCTQRLDPKNFCRKCRKYFCDSCKVMDKSCSLHKCQKIICEKCKACNSCAVCDIENTCIGCRRNISRVSVCKHKYCEECRRTKGCPRCKCFVCEIKLTDLREKKCGHYVCEKHYKTNLHTCEKCKDLQFFCTTHNFLFTKTEKNPDYVLFSCCKKKICTTCRFEYQGSICQNKHKTAPFYPKSNANLSLKLGSKNIIKK